MAADPEVFSNKPDKEEDFFVVEEEEDTGEIFDFYKRYSVEDFLRVLRLVIRRRLNDPQSAHIITVLEHWERRVTDHITAHPEDRNRTKIGFWYGDDDVVRMELSLDGTDFAR